MVDFSKLAASGQHKLPNTLLETFSRLDRQVSHVELRPSQVKILELIDAHLHQRDLVVKLNTGGGKTTVGLLYLKHKLDHLRQPVAYIVPTMQLLAQVVNEGRRIGVAVYPWLAGESYAPEEALSGKGVIACTYDKFFNGKSTFARTDVQLIPAAIVMDDVHAGIEAVRKCFSCEIPPEARSDLLDLLEKDLESLEPGAWLGIGRGDNAAVLEVPHWVFTAHLKEIRQILSTYATSKELVFAWQHLSPTLEMCRLVVSGNSAHLALDPPQVQRIPHYAQASHRMFMSASLHDGAALIRELDCDPLAAASPIEIGNEAMVGERMVIVPSLASPEFSRQDLAKVATGVQEHANVVVLVASYADAEFWKSLGAVVAKNETIEQCIELLRKKDKGALVVFVQRYDGIDLPDKACRLLIIDGLPYGEGLIDRADMAASGGVVGIRGKVANRLEQGLGRAVRSASDYCVTLLAGRDVAGFISRGVVREHFSPQTVRQIEIGETMSRALEESSDRVSDIIETIMQCLKRDSSWKDFYSTQMQSAPADMAKITEVADRSRRMASHERQSLALAAGRDYLGAHAEMQRAVDLSSGDRRVRGVLKQAAAKYLNLVDQVKAMRLQVSAFADNYNISRPPTLIPADLRRVTGQAERIADWLSSFADKNGAVIELNELRTGLAFSHSHRDVEVAVEHLGRLLGADSSRPDNVFTRGPDNLWVFGDIGFVIEMKSEKVSPLSKSDAEQLQSSMLWVEQNFPVLKKSNGFIGSNSDTADMVNDFAFGARLVDEEGFVQLVDRLKSLVAGVCAQGPLFSGSSANIQSVLGEYRLLPDQIVSLGREIHQKVRSK